MAERRSTDGRFLSSPLPGNDDRRDVVSVSSADSDTENQNKTTDASTTGESKISLRVNLLGVEYMKRKNRDGKFIGHGGECHVWLIIKVSCSAGTPL